MRELASLIMRSHGHAMLLAGIFGAVSLVFLPAAFLSAAVLGLIGLRRGPTSAIVVAAGAGCVVAAGWYIVNLRPGLGFPIVLMLWLPVFAGSWVLRRTRSQSASLLTVALMGAVWVVAMHLLTGDVVAFWRGWLSRAVAGVPGATVRGFEQDGTLPLMNGLVAFFFELSAMLSLFLARWMQSLLYYPGGFGEEFQALRLPPVLVPVVAALLLAAWSVSRVMLLDLFLVGLMMYLLVGLAVIHGIVNKRNLPWVWAAPAYVAMAMAPQYAVLGLAILGATDGFLRFRER